jgi:hypothetical protein
MFQDLKKDFCAWNQRVEVKEDGRDEDGKKRWAELNPVLLCIPRAAACILLF